MFEFLGKPFQVGIHVVVRYNDDTIRQTIVQDVTMRRLVVALVALAVMAGCSTETPKPAEKPQPKAPEKITGSSALYKCLIAARGWAPDPQPFRAESQIEDSKGREGKAVTWWVGFASPSRRGVKAYTWSNADITPGVEDSYSPTNSSTRVFNIQFLKVDSDKALEVAQQHGGDKLVEKEPDTPILYLLDWNQQTNELTWHVMYGNSRDTAKLRVAVNASTGEFLRIEK